MSDRNCPNCGAPIETVKCPYCGTPFLDSGAILSRKLPKAVPASQIVGLANKLMQNGILSSNDVRGLIGFMPINRTIYGGCN